VIVDPGRDVDHRLLLGRGAALPSHQGGRSSQSLRGPRAPDSASR
jgi:hypothetical protein